MAPAHHARLDHVLNTLRARGWVVEEGRCLRQQHQSASAPVAERAAEWMGALLRDDIDAILPPWGGELAIEDSLWIDADGRPVATQQLVVSGRAEAGGAAVTWLFKRAS